MPSQQTICALCLSNKTSWFIEVYSEENRSLNIPEIIQKHLWFDLTYDEHSCLCKECWTSLNDFYLFYTKLETIHNVKADESNVSNKTCSDSLREDVAKLWMDCVETNETNAYPEENKAQKVDYLKNDKKHFVSVVDYTDDNDDDYSDIYAPDHDTLDIEDNEEKLIEKENKATKIDHVSEEPIKRRRGRPPKRKQNVPNTPMITEPICNITVKLENVTADLSAAPDIPMARRRGRPPKQKPVDNLIFSSMVKQENNTLNLSTAILQKTVTSEVPVKRGRGRPPKNKPVVKETTRTALDGLPEKIFKLGNQTSFEKNVGKNRTTRNRSIECSSESGDENVSDFEDTLLKKIQKKKPKKASDKTVLKARDKIFEYIDEFACNYCVEKVTFHRFIEADRHYKLVHNEPGFLKCPKCDKKCFNPGMFVSHMETHEDPEKNKCNICGKITDSNISLKKHMRVHMTMLEKNLPFPCSRCKRRFAHEEQREKHEKMHVPKPYVKKEIGPDMELLDFYKRIYCDICEQETPESTSFENFSELKLHMNESHNKGAYLKCPICFKRNLYRPNLITHIDMHKNPEKYRCEVCKEIFQNLGQHMIKSHTANTVVPAEKKYKCDQCGRMFNFLANLKMHIDCIHGLKDIRCNICDKYFNLKAYRVHKKSAHTDQMYMCEQCPKMFKTRSALESHKGHHDDTLLRIIQCPKCDKQIRISNMPKHMKTVHSMEEPVSCDQCGKTFRSTFHMKRHRKNTCAATIDSRKHKCEVCGKGFCMKLTMMEHMTTHTRANQYQCAFCFKSFGYISNLYKHRKKAHPLEWQEVQARPEEGIATVIVVRN